MYYEVNNHLSYKGLQVDSKKVAAFLFLNTNMTETQKELSKDKPFLLKRIKEQDEYIRGLFSKYALNEIDFKRYDELYTSATGVRDTLKKELFDLIQQQDGKESNS